MIQVIEKFDALIEDEVAAYLAQAGAAGEHDPRWLHVLHNALGHHPYMLIARPDGDGKQPVCGYLPLMLVSSRLFGRFLVSLPYLNRAGIVADDSEVTGRLVQGAVELADRLDVQYLELRHLEPVEHEALPQARNEKSLMVLELAPDEEALWQSIRSKVRNQIRKAQKFDLSIRWTGDGGNRGGRHLLDDFYDVFSVNMRDLGTPVYPRKLFSQLLAHFGDRAELAVVRYQDQPVAAALLVHDKRWTQVPSAASLRKFNHTNVNMWMYHQLLLRAIGRGSTHFDFGRSSEGSGTYRFKKQWGATPLATVWQYHVRRGDIHTVRPDSPRYQRRIAAWQKLPVWVTRLIGPPIVRGIP